MIRIGFAISFNDRSWLGGVTYYTNLFNALYALPDRRIQPVVFTGRKTSNQLAAAFPDIPVIKTALLDTDSPYYLVRRFGQRYLETDALFERLLRSHRVAALSHSGHLGRRARVATLGWITDFQHLHLPELFDATELASRDREYHAICRLCDTVLFSSNQAYLDATRFAPDCAPKGRVLRFVSDPTPHLHKVNLETLQQRYGFHGKYFYVPNQFWIHKNHQTIIDALALIRDKDIQVIATGNPNDFRQPDHFRRLMNHAANLGVTDRFKVLGMVPYEDLVGLMYHAVAIINPSLSEGWSTTVEEAKTMGKRILLSNIAVHLEQAPERGEFFDPNRPEDLAELLMEALASTDPEEESRQTEKAMSQLPARYAGYGRQYQDIVLETLNRRPS